MALSQHACDCTSPGALPLISVVYESDPRNIPIVYDCPACSTIVNTTLLECPRFTGRFLFEEGPDEQFGQPVFAGGVGALSESVVGQPALRAVVGVFCQGRFQSIVICILVVMHAGCMLQSAFCKVHFAESLQPV